MDNIARKISSYYGIEVYNLKSSNKDYLFDDNSYTYILKNVNYSELEIQKYYEMSIRALYCGIRAHQIIKHKYSNFIIIIDSNQYVLMKISNKETNVSERIISNFNYKIGQGKCYWKELWAKKIDFLEEQFYELKDISNKSSKIFNYYIGLAEMAMNLMDEEMEFDIYISHKRISNDIIEYFDPFNLQMDIKPRDISEYIKYIYIESCNSISPNNKISELKEFINNVIMNLNNNEKIYFFLRMLYFTPFFDVCERYFEGRESLSKITDFIRYIDGYEELLLYVYEQVDFYVKMPRCQFLEKEKK